MKVAILLIAVAAFNAEASFLGNVVNSVVSNLSNADLSKLGDSKLITEFLARCPAEDLAKVAENAKAILTGLGSVEDLGRYLKNMREILNQEVSGTSTHTTGLNCFSILSADEFKAKYLTLKPSGDASSPTRPTETRRRRQTVTVPASQDWRTKGYVSAVQNQGQCGSCWTFSAAGAMEGAIFKKTGKLPNLSEQNLVDCVTASGGCNGGWMTDAYDYVIKTTGMANDTSYPYLAKQQTCAYTAAKKAGTVTKYAYTLQNDETDLQRIVGTVGPVAVGIDASNLTSYTGGIYTCPTYGGMDHGVLVVGYGTDTTTTPPTDYWILKNSWGTSWGEKGFFRIKRNSGNQCGVAEAASYVTA